MSETHVVALSGGKDSTCLALRLAEVEPRDYLYFCTPTGAELPEMEDHWGKLEQRLGKPLLRLSPCSLEELCEQNHALPSFRLRFCTRQLKIVPALQFLKTVPNPVLYVGLRADEEARSGLYDPSVTVRHPLREWGWGEPEVIRFLRERGVAIPWRTDCDTCPFQRLGEWRELLRRYPDRYRRGEEMEERFGSTFRSPGRDTRPTALKELRMYFEQQPLLPFEEDDLDWEESACRVCRM